MKRQAKMEARCNGERNVIKLQANAVNPKGFEIRAREGGIKFAGRANCKTG